jgi:hypothetical protein
MSKTAKFGKKSQGILGIKRLTRWIDSPNRCLDA